MKQRVIYVHPKGRFKVVERLVINPLGEKHWIREAVPLPPDPSRYVPGEYQQSRQLSHQAKKDFSGAQILMLFRKGHSIQQISEETGKSLCKVRTSLRDFYNLLEGNEQARLYRQSKGGKKT